MLALNRKPHIKACIMQVLILAFSNLYAQLVTNGSFENTATGPVTGNEIEGWELYSDADISPAPEFEIVNDEVQDGNGSLKIVVHGVGSDTWSIYACAKSIPVKPGKTYRYSIWAKSKYAGAQVHFTVGNYSYYEYGAYRPAYLSSDMWQKYEFDFTITDQNTIARAPVHFSISENAGNTIYIDNLEITDIEQDLAARKPVIFQAESGELGSDFAIKESGGITYIQIQTNGADYTPAIWNYPGYASRVVSYSVTFPAGGTYDLFTRIRVGPQRFDDDSFFYADGFGSKNVTDENEWIIVNQLQTSGFSDMSHVVHDPGGLAEGVWKWVNLSQNTYHEQGTAFTVEENGLTVTFQIGGRETGLDIDRFAFGRSDLYYTVGNLENVEPGSEETEGEVWQGPPLAEGHAKFLGCAYNNVQAVNFKSYWNQVTPDDAGKWGSVEGTRDVMNWGGLDAAYNFAKNNGFLFRLAVLVWGNQQPAWIEDLSDKPAEQLEEIREWFEAVAARYPELDFVEVVNEPLHDPPAGATNGNYINALGGEGTTGWDWVLNAFRMAREIFPPVTKLILNDYSILTSSTNVNRYLEIIHLLQAENLIDGVGDQCHAISTTSTVATITKNLNTLAGAGLPIQITEMDIDGPTDQAQLQDYQNYFPVLWEHPAVIGITLWGWRPGLWRHAQKAYIVELNGDERPALEWLREYVPSTVSKIDPVFRLPGTFELYNNYPNPFNPLTGIRYDLPGIGRVRLEVFDILGRHVQTLVNHEQSPGSYTVTFNAGDLPGGIYFYRLETGSFMKVKRMLLLK